MVMGFPSDVVELSPVDEGLLFSGDPLLLQYSVQSTSLNEMSWVS